MIIGKFKLFPVADVDKSVICPACFPDARYFVVRERFADQHPFPGKCRGLPSTIRFLTCYILVLPTKHNAIFKQLNLKTLKSQLTKYWVVKNEAPFLEILTL